MTPENSPTPFEFIPGTSIEDQLAKLCRVQQTRITSLSDQLARALQANQTLGNDLLRASEARAEVLVSLQAAVKEGRELCHLLVSQRDTVFDALRRLCDHLANQPVTSLTYFGGDAFAKSVREADELVKVIRQLQAKQKALDDRLPPVPPAGNGKHMPPTTPG